MAIEFVIHVHAKDKSEAARISRKILDRVSGVIAQADASLKHRKIQETDEHEGTHKCRTTIRLNSQDSAERSEAIINECVTAIGGEWETSEDGLKTCSDLLVDFPDVKYMRLEVSTVQPQNVKHSRRTVKAKNDEFVPKGLKGRVLLIVEALFVMPLAILCAVPTLGAIHRAWLCFGLNTAFLIAALLALLAVFTVGVLGIYLLYTAASALQGAICPRNQLVPCNENTFCVRTIVFVACLFAAVDIISLSCWHRHLWQPMTLKAPIDGRFKEVEDIPNVSLVTADIATIKEGVRLIFPRYHGTHRYWIYVDNEIAGKVVVESNTNLEMSETGNLVHLSSRSGDLLLTFDHEQELPIHYPGGVGLFGEPLPTLAYDDPKLFQCFELGRNPGTYSIEIVELVDARFARYHNRLPLDVVLRKDIIVEQGRLSPCYTQYSDRQYVQTVMPAKRHFATAQQRADYELQEAKSALRRFESDPLVQVVKQFQASGRDRLMLDLSDASLGTREIDTEQIYHFARWISAKYNAMVTQ